jgi:hypothetical protein
MPKMVLPLAVGAAALLVAGCGSDTSSAHTLPAKVQAPSAASTAPGCASQVTVTAADNGHEVCLSVGGRVKVGLAAGWGPVSESGAALSRVSGTEFDGAGAGQAQLMSSQRACPQPTGDGVMVCGAIRGWRVTVVVR